MRCLPYEAHFLLEHIFRLVKEVAENVLVILLGLFALKTCELFEQMFLLSCHVRWRYDLDLHMLITTRTTMNDGYTHTFETE